jgi:hypothetical protein
LLEEPPEEPLLQAARVRHADAATATAVTRFAVQGRADRRDEFIDGARIFCLPPGPYRTG